jgi:subtilisin family serine protease
MCRVPLAVSCLPPRRRAPAAVSYLAAAVSCLAAAVSCLAAAVSCLAAAVSCLPAGGGAGSSAAAATRFARRAARRYLAGVRMLCAAFLTATVGFAVPATPASAVQPDVVRGLQWQIAKLKLEEVHRSSTGQGVVVAVVDSGVDGQHPDLVGQVLQGPDPRAGTDIDGRGTGLAGIIAGHGHGQFTNGGDAGVLGVAPGAKILPIAFAPTFAESGTADDMATGIELAVNRGAKIICVARGVQPSERLQFAIDVAFEKNVLVIAPDSSTWPASYPGVMTAIAADRLGEVRVSPATGRSTGVVVPGIELMTTDRAAGYRFADPSISAGVLAGAAALVWSVNPEAKAAEIMNLLRATATDRGVPGPDTLYGAGELNLTQALRAGVPKPKASPSPVTAPGANSARPGADLPSRTLAQPLLDSTDWRRWLVVLPLLFFLVALGFWSYRSAHQRRAGS